MTHASYQAGLLFTKAHKLVRARMYDVLSESDLTPSYWSILSITVLSTEGVRLANVAKEMDVKAPLVTMLANDLISKGLIVRIPHHTDKRAKLLVATKKGKALAAKIETQLTNEISQLMRGVSPQEIAAFERTLSAIIANA